MMNNSEAKKRLVLKTHKMVSNILELAGELYFLKVPKSFKKPPSVGFRFRSYTDSHYTSEDRDNPIACKVREFPSESEDEVYRLYHFYKGKKSKKRKREDELMNIVTS